MRPSDSGPKLRPAWQSLGKGGEMEVERSSLSRERPVLLRLAGRLQRGVAATNRSAVRPSSPTSTRMQTVPG